MSQLQALQRLLDLIMLWKSVEGELALFHTILKHEWYGLKYFQQPMIEGMLSYLKEFIQRFRRKLSKAQLTTESLFKNEEEIQQFRITYLNTDTKYWADSLDMIKSIEDDLN